MLALAATAVEIVEHSIPHLDSLRAKAKARLEEAADAEVTAQLALQFSTVYTDQRAGSRLPRAPTCKTSTKSLDMYFHHVKSQCTVHAAAQFKNSSFGAENAFPKLEKSDSLRK